MALLSPIWLIAGFGVGFITFQMTRAKGLFNTVSSAAMVLGLISLLSGQPQAEAVVEFIGLDYISGVFTGLAYLMGANISRFRQFGTMSPRIIIYLVAFVLLASVVPSSL